MTGTNLKIKTGYNPNSSSIGVDMVAFFTGGSSRNGPLQHYRRDPGATASR